MGVVEWTRGPTIGRGSSATVSLAVDRLTGELFAVKTVGADRAAELKREQSILSGLSSPYVVRCLGSTVSASEDASGAYDMLMEYAPGGSLADEIRRRGGQCEEALIQSRARDILLGLAHAHDAGVAHCDVKSRNVLIGADGRAMIADFGCARRTTGGGIAGEHRVMGTPAFMAPEAARGEAQGPAADIWALGCTIIEMATGAAPWQRFASTVATLHHVAFSGEAPELPRWLSEEGKDFLGRCLLQDAAKRWTAEQLLEHEFVAAAAVLPSSSVQGIAEKGMFVSPKSVLDQALWEDDEDTTADTATACPIDRVRGLAAGAPDWTWDASWITVHSSGPTVHGDDERAMSPEADTDGDSPVGGSSSSAGRVADAGASNSQASSHADGDRHNDTSSCKCNGERSDDGDHVISSDCTAILPITSNGFFSDMLLVTDSWAIDQVIRHVAFDRGQNRGRGQRAPCRRPVKDGADPGVLPRVRVRDCSNRVTVDTARRNTPPGENLGQNGALSSSYDPSQVSVSPRFGARCASFCSERCVTRSRLERLVTRSRLVCTYSGLWILCAALFLSFGNTTSCSWRSKSCRSISCPDSVGTCRFFAAQQLHRLPGIFRALRSCASVCGFSSSAPKYTRV
ncbi:mitogen-activated protein kinase kinase kinase 18-like [Lolium rigidum]|uniref:mitogen-activated protein kinase kinase kinase 18-like n=1 Tax=Lolium rigidum TaxID=89674 RepID=UPI001F5D405A|nr:mitogen-activated protein kinase kinase kinase 18-like [Lolium rigidum]